MIFRIGVNLGDVIQEGDRIYGDGVNIAARIEGLADGGGICISGTAYDQIKNKLALGYNYFGEHSVKNISEPVRVYKVPMEPGDVGKTRPGAKGWKKNALIGAIILILCATAFAVWHFYFRPPPVEIVTEAEMAFPLPDKPSIAVLPFANISGDPKEDYLSDGITEQIITALSKIPRIFVIARNSTFTYKGKPVKVQQVSRELGVRYVLEGSVQKSENRLRITAQLIDAKTGAHLWAEKYDREFNDIFVLQDEISLKVLAALQIHLGEGEGARLSAKGTDNIEAYIKVLHGLWFFHQGDKENFLVKAPKMFEEAIAIDPQYATPYFYLAYIKLKSIRYDHSINIMESGGAATMLLYKGLDINNSSAIGKWVQSAMRANLRSYELSIKSAQEAIRIEPNMAAAYAQLGQTLHFVGRNEEAISQLKKAIRLNPIPPVYYYFWLGNAYQLSGMLEESISAYNKAILQNPKFVFAHMRLAVSYVLMGRMEEARSEAAEVLRIDPNFSSGTVISLDAYKDEATKDLIYGALLKIGLK